MKKYEKNVHVVIDTLERYQYSQKKLYLSKKCYAELERYIKEQNTEFSLDIALYWCENKVKGKEEKIEFRKAIYRLNDVYRYKCIHGCNLRFCGKISEPYSSIVDNYLKSISETQSYIRYKKQICRLFCLFLITNGVPIEKITYTILKQYHKHIQKTVARDIEAVGIISEFLKYCADNKYCHIKYSLFMHSIVMDKCVSLRSFSQNSIHIIEDRKNFGNGISSEEFYETIPKFINALSTYGYSQTTLKNAKNYLLYLYSFIDSENLNYDRIIADTWLNECGVHLFGVTMVGKARLTVKRYNDYIITGIIDINKTSVAPEYNNLPLWCKLELEQFFENKKREGLSDGTIVSYRTSTTRFCKFLTLSNVKSFSEITSEKIKQFNIRDKHKTPAGKNSCNMRIRKFLIYLELRKLVPLGIHYALACNASNNKKIVEILNQEDRLIFNEYCKTASTKIQLRDAAILKIAMTTALRASDIVNLKISDIDWKNKLIRNIQKKTKTERSYILDVETGNAIFRYLRDARYKNADNDYLFITSHAPFRPLKTKVCTDAMRRAGTSATDFHRLRRTCATDILRSGATFIETAEIIGHSDTHNVHKYISLDRERMMLCPLSLAETNLLIERRYGL